MHGISCPPNVLDLKEEGKYKEVSKVHVLEACTFRHQSIEESETKFFDRDFNLTDLTRARAR